MNISEEEQDRCLLYHQFYSTHLDLFKRDRLEYFRQCFRFIDREIHTQIKLKKETVH